jgi:hypothetical protein
MRISEIISEEMDVTEARPMGILNRIGQTALSMTPTNIGKKAKGTLETGKIANQLMNQYMQWLGKNQYEENKESLVNFLKQSGLPNDAIQAASNVLDNAQVRPSSTQPTTNQPQTPAAPQQNNTTPQPNAVSEADGDQSTKLDSKIISQAIMAAVVQQVRSGQPMNNVGTRSASGTQQTPTSSSMASGVRSGQPMNNVGTRSASGTQQTPTSSSMASGGGNANTASSNNTVDQMRDTADSTQSTQPAAQNLSKQNAIQKPTGPQPGQQVTFPGTTPPVVFKYNPQWIDSSGNPASADVVAALNQLAVGQDPSMPALKKARSALGLPESKKMKRNLY